MLHLQPVSLYLTVINYPSSTDLNFVLGLKYKQYASLIISLPNNYIISDFLLNLILYPRPWYGLFAIASLRFRESSYDETGYMSYCNIVWLELCRLVFEIIMTFK